jgi:lipopolysaccharide export system ATP-binding protein
LNGEDVTDAPMYVRARKGIGYLPQEPSIFRGLTVEQNILGILETLDLDRATRQQRLVELLAEAEFDAAGEGAGAHVVRR